MDKLRGSLTEGEWQELLALEYVITWGYTNDIESDWNRYIYLADKRWYSLGRK